MKIVPMCVTLIDSMGGDLSVVNAARVSFDKESEWCKTCSCCGMETSGNQVCSHCGEYHYDVNELSQADSKLISYLSTHNHFSPFCHSFASFRIKAPLFVARQLGKHQVGLAWNEVSRRYVDSEPEFFIPEYWRKKPEGSIKQGSSDETVYLWNDDFSVESIVALRVRQSLQDYNHMLGIGIAPELARMVLPQNTMTEWIWSGSLFAFARVCNLRLDPHAQKECQEVAQMINDEMVKLFPVSWKALVKESE